MGAVYRAERVPVGKAVAIKFLHASFASDPEFLGRFERETRVMSKLAHPHCVSVLDFGVAGGAPYLVMDYVAGQTLRELLDDGPLAPALALGLMRQILAGLAYAHAQGIVHRDIKPANIMVTEEIGTGAHVRILDFGLARLRGAISSGATQSMIIVGTPSYMAPEQTVGGTVDGRADIYAAGVVLFEMITGRKPFAAEDAFDLLGMHRGAPIPRLADVMPAGAVIPPGLQAMIDTAMAKAPAARYQSAIEFADAIDADASRGRRLGSASLRIEAEEAHDATAVDVSRTATREATAAPPPRARGRGLLIALGLIGAVGAAAWALAGRGDEDAPAVAARASAIDAGAPDAIALAAVVVDAPGAVDAAVIAADAPEPVAVDAADPLALDAGPASEDVEPADPTKAEDPDPTAGAPTAEDEAADAPADTAAVEAHSPVAPSPAHATTVAGAVRLIKDGQRALALASLRTLARSNPRSAYIPFLLGNLYFDQQWWSVAMDHYRLAITRNTAYRGNPILIRNVIRTLASTKTRGKAIYFLRRTIGRPALAYLRTAAARDPSATVRKQAAALARAMR